MPQQSSHNFLSISCRKNTAHLFLALSPAPLVHTAASAPSRRHLKYRQQKIKKTTMLFLFIYYLSLSITLNILLHFIFILAT